MNTTVFLSLLSFVGFFSAAILLISYRKRILFSRRVFFPLLASLFLYSFIVISNLLEHSKVTSLFDPVEDLAEVLFTLVFLFFIYSWRSERTEMRFKDLFWRAPIPFAEVTRDGRLLKFNKQMAEELEQRFGVSVEKTTAIETWWRNAFPDRDVYDKVVETWRAAVDQTSTTDGIIEPQETVMVCRDGSSRSKLVGGSIIGDNLLLTMIDITDRKHAAAEKEKLQKQLLQSQKLEAIGTLAGGVAHDFNNILGAIIGYAELTLDSVHPSDNSIRPNVEKILEAAERSSRLTRQLLIFARKQKTKMEVVDLNTALKTMYSMLQRLIGENITLAWVPYKGQTQCSVKIDPTQLDQVLVNLCINARDAIHDIGKITIKADIVSFDELTCKAYVNCSPGTYVRLSVTDDGCGMDKETVNHIFEPFFTTKGVGEGTGLGLATVYGIVTQSGGFINCYSEQNIGTTFDIYLPFQDRGDSIKLSHTDVSVPKGNGETVLLVEDDPALLEMSHRMLKLLDYNVVPTACPSEAIAEMKSRTKDIDLVLSDVIMPEMNGHELLNRLQEICPDVRYLFMSGYTANVIVPKGILDENATFIQKPFTRKEIAQKLRGIFDN